MPEQYSEEDLLMLSALQHLLFCPRQCALIHVEQLWVENRLTAEGKIMHERVHQSGKESRKTKRIEFDVPLRSLTLGLTGRADMVEHHKQPNGDWIIFPVEYKRGRPKKDNSDKVQLCAQAMCLEEMQRVEILSGALFYGQKHRRVQVDFSQKLRAETIETAANLHQLVNSRQTPPPKYSTQCNSCSFIDICLPETMGKKNKVKNYMQRMIAI